MASDVPTLLSRIASGDRDAFAALYDEWFSFVLGQARRACPPGGGDEHTAADLVQEVFLKMIRRTPILDSPAALGAWLKRAAYSSAMDRAKAEARRRARERRAVAMGAGDDHDTDRLAWLRRELDRIDAEARDMLRQRFVLGRTLAQIGRVFGMSPSAVDGRIGRVLRLLARRAGEVDDGE